MGRGVLPVSGTTFEEDDQVHVLVHASAVDRFQKMMGWK
jgi:Trk K+ transport system NAD-binding subunit